MIRFPEISHKRELSQAHATVPFRHRPADDDINRVWVTFDQALFLLGKAGRGISCNE